MAPYNIVVFVDIPDPDNILMILDVLNQHPREHIAVVLSTRLVDLSAPRYGPDFMTIKEKTSIQKMAIPIESDELQDVPNGLGDWFYKDENNSNLEVKTDSNLYMEVSSIRIAEVLAECGMSYERYTIFWDERSLDTVTRPDMRHAFHVHDFSYNFNKMEMERYESVISEYRTRDTHLRVELRHIIEAYIKRLRRRPLIGNEKSRIHPFEELIQANQQLNDALLIIGGPFTDPLAYLKRTRRPKKIVAMGASIKNDRNVFKAQFNFWKDMNAGNEFLKLIQAHRIKLYMVPTECVKGTTENPCPFEFDLKVYGDILKSDSLLYRTIEQYTKDTGKGQHYSAFDWVTAIAAHDRTIFTWKKVNVQVELDLETITVTIVNDNESSIRMAWDDYDYMTKRKGYLIRQMQRTASTNPGERITQSDRHNRRTV
ncbi:hypothetical protein DPSP01_014666 [Paraphaeosphaeria sporulosa]